MTNCTPPTRCVICTACESVIGGRLQERIACLRRDNRWLERNLERTQAALAKIKKGSYEKFAREIATAALKDRE